MDKNLIQNFKKSLFAAAKLFNRAPSEVTIEQWLYVSKGQMTRASMRIIGFRRLKDFVAPTKNMAKQEQKALKDLISKLVKNA